jgi:hypothetical protein
MRATRRIACAALVALSLAACTSGGTTPQSGPSAAESTNSSQSSETASSPAAVASAAAISRYLEFDALMNTFDRDPVHSDFDKLNGYLTGQAVAIFRDSLVAMVSKGLAYRGKDDDPRVKVLSVTLPDLVLLTTCPLPSPTDPFTQITVATGQPVATTAPAVPTPWLRTIMMKESGGIWRVSDISVDNTKTCVG